MDNKKIINLSDYKDNKKREKYKSNDSIEETLSENYAEKLSKDFKEMLKDKKNNGRGE